MKKTSYLINTARGDIVVEKDLVKALNEDSIMGAGLDVYEAEPKVNEGLLKLKCFSITSSWECNYRNKRSDGYESI